MTLDRWLKWYTFVIQYGIDITYLNLNNVFMKNT